MGLALLGVTIAVEELPSSWSILSPPLTWVCAETANADTARPAKIAIMYVVFIF
jgi:hypothetical protein